MDTKKKIIDLIGKDLKGFTIDCVTEVYRTNGDGCKSQSFGFFRDRHVAEVFAGIQTDSCDCHVEDILILTDGNIGYGLTGQGARILSDDKAEMYKIRKAILEKLSGAEKRLLGLFGG